HPGNFHGRPGQLCHLLWAGIADGIGNRDEIEAGLQTFFDQLDHFIRIDRPGDRAAQRHRYRGVDDRLMRTGVSQRAEPLQVSDSLIARSVSVGLTMLFSRRGQRFVDAAFVERQCNTVRARKRRHRSHDIADIGKLRKRGRRQERADLEMPYARAVFLAHPPLLRLGRWKRLHQLQAVTQAYFAQAHAIVGINVLNSGHASLTAVLAVDESSRSARPARTVDVSAPRTGTFSPSPRLAPFHSIGSAGTRKGSPLKLKLLTRPPGRSTCGYSSRSSGRLIGENEI